jgi:hypothetical protein
MECGCGSCHSASIKTKGERGKVKAEKDETVDVGASLGAMGNRSIVCDPRRGSMKDILNLKIKRRESFRPFAPSILRESVSKWFEEDDGGPHGQS